MTYEFYTSCFEYGGEVLLNNKGFSLVEIMIAIGLLGGLSTALMNLNKQALTTSARSNVDFEINLISNRVMSLLSDQVSCTYTMTQFGDIRIDKGTSVKSFKDNHNAAIELDSNSVKILSINVVNSDGTGPILATSISSNEGDVKVKLNLERTVMGKKSTINKLFGVKIYTDANFNVKKCYVSLDNAIKTAVETSCTNLGGVLSGTDCLINGQKLPATLTSNTNDISLLNAKIASLTARVRILELKPAVIPTNTNNTNTTTTTTTTDQPCYSGSVTYSSPLGTNSCLYSWGPLAVGDSVTPSSTNGGTGSWTCNSPGGNGGLSNTHNCPENNTTATSCVGGNNVSILSTPTGKVNCIFTWPQGNIGQNLTVTGTNGGRGSVTCNSDGRWGYSYTCADPNVVTCAAGQGTFPSKTNTAAFCTCNWQQAVAGAPAVGTCTAGGSITGTCSAAGTWVSVVSDCP